MIKFIDRFPIPALLLLGLLFYLPFIGSTHLFDWDEINFAESAREMLLTSDYFSVQVNFQRFWEKPPFFIWLQAASMKVFGVSEFAARFPNVLFGLATLISFYIIGLRERSHRFGLMWAILYLGSLLPTFYFKSGIIDPAFNLFMFWAVYAAYKTQPAAYKSLKWPLICGLSIGLAIITKGPVGLLIPLLTILVIYIWRRARALCSWRQLLVVTGSALLVSFAWFGYDLIKNGPWFLVEFVEYQIELFTQPVAGHERPFYFHLLVVFVGCLPFSIFAIPQFKPGKEARDLQSWMFVLFVLVMLIFSISSTKIVHYSSMCYLPLSFLAALQLEKWDLKGFKNKFTKLYLLIAFALLGLCMIAIAYLFANPELWLHQVKDPFLQQAFTQPASWKGLDIWLWIIIPAIGLYWFFFAKKFQILRNLIVISLSFCLFLNLYLFMVVPKIEQYTQKPIIEFYESLQGKEVNVQPYYFKSYAHLFYTRKPWYQDEEAYDSNIMLNGNPSRPTFIIVKAGKRKAELIERPDMQFVGDYGGYSVFKRP